MSNRTRLPLGDYYQLLLRHGLLADAAPLAAGLTHPVSLVSCDSKLVIPNTLFVCKGVKFKEEYLRSAMEQGAFAYVSEREYPAVPLPCIRVTDIRQAMGLLADRAYGHPSGALRITGITGTKGKTTTAYYIKSIVDAWLAGQGHRESALLSTIVTDDGVERRPAKLTTPEPLDLQRHLWNAVSAGADYLTMEVSSQALKYGRVIGVELACAVFLNIGEDHISPVEHPDLEDYLNSKLLIFQQARSACVCLDCDHVERVRAAAAACPRVVTFSQKFPSADVYGSQVRKEGEKIAFHVRTPRYERELAISTPGLFNVENALAAVAVAEAYGIPADVVAGGLVRAFVPGRMEHYVSADGQISVIVDYSHNGMSLQNALRSVRAEYPGRELTVLFGCTGGKGIDRREGMGNAAGEWADRIILTEDDPGPEEVEAICADIGVFLAAHGKDYTVIPNREAAVETAILGARRPAVVLLAGKGCEEAQKRKNGPEPCIPDGTLARRLRTTYPALYLSTGAREKVETLCPAPETVLVAAFPYYAGERPGNLSLYARGEDYHRVVTRRLNTVCDALRRKYPEESFVPAADNSPLPEREAAWLAGIGLRGKNGLLILPPYGTYVFLGTILTGAALDVPERPAAPDCPGCGACRAACPAGALGEGGPDVSRCLSELTQKKGALTEEEAARLRVHPLIWGCDFCQRACPYNAAPARSPLPEFSTSLVDALENSDLEGLTNRTFRDKYGGRAFAWRGPGPLRRNLGLKEE